MIRVKLTLLLIVAAVALTMPGPLRAQECPAFRWERFISAGPQDAKVYKEHQSALGKRVTEVHFGALEGRYAKVYLFAEYDGDCLRRVVSAGSYALTALLSDADDEAKRLHHFDLYTVTMHATLGFEEGTPDLDAFRKMAFDVLNTRPDEGAD